MADADDQQQLDENPELSGFSNVTKAEVAELNDALNKLFAPYSKEVSQCILTMLIYGELRELGERLKKVEDILERIPI